MDDSPVPKKRARSSSSLGQPASNLAMTEYVREFALPQAYPSLAKYDGSKETATATSSAGAAPKLGHLPKILKLKTKNGQNVDLNVKVMPQNTPVTCVNGKSISLSLKKPLVRSNEPFTPSIKVTTLGSTATTTSISKSPVNNPPQNAYQALDQKLNKNPNSAIKYVIPPHLKNIKFNLSDSDSIDSLNMSLGSDFTNPIYQLGNNIMVSNDNELPSIDLTDSAPSEIVMQQGKGWRVLMKEPEKTVLRNVQTKGANINMDDSNFNVKKPSSLLRRGTSLINTANKLPFRTLKTSNQSNIVNNRQQVNSKSGSRFIQIAGNNKGFDHGYAVTTDNYDQNFISYVDDSQISNGMINFEENSNLDNTVYVLQDEDNFDQEQTDDDLSTKNIKQSVPLVNSQGKVNLIRRGNNKGINSIGGKSKKDGNPRKSFSPTRDYRSPYLRDDLTDEEISSKLSVVGEALSTVCDEDLKMRALRALEECGIGMERFIPKKPPHNYISVKDTQTQTNVFGLLEKNKFIRVTGSSKDLERLEEIEKQIIGKDIKQKSKPCEDTVKFRDDLDNMLEKGDWVNKTGVAQVKDLLRINPVVEKAYKILERDLKTIKQYDENGLLNIHRAVLANDHRVLKRHILMLKIVKETVDVPTQDKQTSLEMAIQHAATPEVVNLLLKSGANPVSSENAHNSALAIASRISSDSLPDLVKFLSSSNPAINNVDSEGFTALHHCARNGNYRGIMCLLAINADVNARDCRSGRTALFHAFENESINICKELLTAGAKPNIPNFAGQTVLTIYDEEKHFLLKDYFDKFQK